MSAAHQFTCVAIGGRAMLIRGVPGSGKSALALELIDRGAILVGDDSVLLDTDGTTLVARPHPHTRGLLEVRNLGLLPFPVLDQAPVALIVALDNDAPRYIEEPEGTTVLGIALPLVRLRPGAGPLSLKAELALERYGLSL